MSTLLPVIIIFRRLLQPANVLPRIKSMLSGSIIVVTSEQPLNEPLRIVSTGRPSYFDGDLYSRVISVVL